jgi:hypothetical protein
VSCDRSALLARLRRLDPATRAAVVADCWAAAGHDVEREATAVRVEASGGRRRLSTVDDPTADRVLDAAAVREVLLYRVDRPDADRIAERHLGAPLDGLRQPLGRRAASAVRALATPATVVLAVVLVGAAGGLVGGEGADQPTTATATATPSPAPATSSPAPTRNVTAPGLGPDGVTDLAALASAHGRARPDAHVVWVDFERGDGAVVRDVDLRVDGDRYRAAVRVERGGRVTSRAAVYGDGRERYALIADEEQTTRALQPTEAGPAGVDPQDLGAEGVRYWLSAPETRVTGVLENEGWTGYRVVGTGVPPTRTAAVESYRFEALVAPDGVVGHLVVEFELADAEDGDRRFEWTYGEQAPTVTRPDWVERGSNETAPRRALR